MWILDDNVRKIIDSLANKKTVRELELRKKLRIRESEIRKVLYRLHELGIVYPIRSIITDKKYDYEWGVKVNNLYEIYRIIVERELRHLKERLAQEPDTIYVCENCGLSFDFDTADELDFKCPECGSILMPKVNYRRITIMENIKKLQDLLESYKPKGKIKARSGSTLKAKSK